MPIRLLFTTKIFIIKLLLVSRFFSTDYTDRPRTRAAGSAPPVYGRIVHKAPPGSRLRSSQQMPHRTKAFEDVAYLYGTINFHPPSSRRRQSSFRIGGGASPPISQVPQAGSFQHLRDLIRGERARELRVCIRQILLVKKKVVNK